MQTAVSAVRALHTFAPLKPGARGVTPSTPFISNKNSWTSASAIVAGNGLSRCPLGESMLDSKTLRTCAVCEGLLIRVTAPLTLDRARDFMLVVRTPLVAGLVGGLRIPCPVPIRPACANSTRFRAGTVR